MDRSASTLEAYDQANALYWGSERSVNQIAEELDLSKGALYGMIRPLAADMGCPTCGAEVAHPNRTAKDRGLVDCTACGWDGTEDEAAPGYAATDVFAGESAGQVGPFRNGAAADAFMAPDSSSRALLGGALLGTAVGLALVLWARRR